MYGEVAIVVLAVILVVGGFGLSVYALLHPDPDPDNDILYASVGFVLMVIGAIIMHFFVQYNNELERIHVRFQKQAKRLSRASNKPKTVYDSFVKLDNNEAGGVPSFWDRSHRATDLALFAQDPEKDLTNVDVFRQIKDRVRDMHPEWSNKQVVLEAQEAYKRFAFGNKHLTKILSDGTIPRTKTLPKAKTLTESELDELFRNDEDSDFDDLDDLDIKDIHEMDDRDLMSYSFEEWGDSLKEYVKEWTDTIYDVFQWVTGGVRESDPENPLQSKHRSVYQVEEEDEEEHGEG